MSVLLSDGVRVLADEGLDVCDVEEGLAFLVGVSKFSSGEKVRRRVVDACDDVVAVFVFDGGVFCAAGVAFLLWHLLPLQEVQLLTPLSLS